MNAIILLRPNMCNANKLLIVDSSMMHMCKNGDIVYKDGAYHAFFNGCLLNIMTMTCKLIIIPAEVTNCIDNILNYYDALYMLIPNYNIKVIMTERHVNIINKYYKQMPVKHMMSDHMLIDYNNYVKYLIHKQNNKSTLVFVECLK